ncbi:MAG: VOC family protein [Planctomycetota bacterium]|nr:MAG: VOC family protein [Planctomycetota bacterium]
MRAMISGGNTTVYVSDLNAAVRFYCDTLGCELVNRVPEHWALVSAGPGVNIGLHPQSPRGPKPGARGAMSIGFNVTRPLAEVVRTLEDRGVRFDGHSDSPKEPVRLSFFSDPDGNPLYLCEYK